MAERVVELNEFVHGSFRPLAEQLAGAGLPNHLVIVQIPERGMLRVYSGLPPAARADLMERTADDLKKAAAELRKQPGQSILTPGVSKLKGL